MRKNNRHSVATRLVTGGRSREVNRGAVNPPVVHVSTFLFDSLQDMRQVSARPTDRGGQYYGRVGTQTTRALEDAITLIDGGSGCVLFPSGISAITGAMLAFLERGDHLLMVDTCYGPTRTFCDRRLKALGVDVTYYDPMIGAGIADLIRADTRCIFLESPGSITFEIQDVPTICTAARAAGAVTMMDNTWATPLFFDAFAHGVDVSIQAGTKYFSGHADVMAGSVSASDPDHVQRVRDLAFDLGLHMAPDDCYLLLRGLRTLQVRLERHERTALELAAWLEGRPGVRRVLHPAFQGCPGHAEWKRDFSGASGLFAIVIDPVDTRALGAMLDDMELFGMGYSWGGYESLMIPMNPESLRTASNPGIDGTLLRIHAGLEDSDDLIRDLEAGFARLWQASAKGPGKTERSA